MIAALRRLSFGICKSKFMNFFLSDLYIYIYIYSISACCGGALRTPEGNNLEKSACTQEELLDQGCGLQ